MNRQITSLLFDESANQGAFYVDQYISFLFQAPGLGTNSENVALFELKSKRWFSARRIRSGRCAAWA
jgi:hypothetical protein